VLGMITAERVEAAEAELARNAPTGYLIGLGRALVELDGELDWPYFLEKPYKWAREYVAWLDHDRPDTGDGAAWDSFADAVEEVRR